MPEAAKFYINLARLVDRAVVEYEEAREALSSFRDFRAFNTLVNGVSSIEAGITSTHRALQFIGALRRVGLLDAEGAPLVPRPRDFIPSHEAVAGVYKNVRDAIQHLDERMSSAGLGPRDVIMVEPTEDDFNIEGHTIRYADWCNHLRQLDAFVRRIATVPTAQLTIAMRGEA